MSVHITCTSPDSCQSSCFERWNCFHHQITQNDDILHAMDPTGNRGEVCPSTYHEEVQGSGGVPPLIHNRVRTKLKWSTSSPGRFTTPPTLPRQTAHVPLKVEAERNPMMVWALWGKENLFLPGIKLRFVYRPVSSLITKPTELHQV